MGIITKGVQVIRRSTLRHNRSPSQESNGSSPPSPTISKTPSITSSVTSDDGSCYSAGGYHNVVTPSHTPKRNSLSGHSPISASITITPMIDSPPTSPINNNINANTYKDSIPIAANRTETINARKTSVQKMLSPEEPVSSVPDYLSTSPTRASPLSPLPRVPEQQPLQHESTAADGYFSLPPSPDPAIICTSSSTNSTTDKSVSSLAQELNSSLHLHPSSTTSADRTQLTPTFTRSKSSFSKKSNHITFSESSRKITANQQPPRSPMRSHFQPRPVYVSSKAGSHASMPRGGRTGGGNNNNSNHYGSGAAAAYSRRRQHRKLKLDDFNLKRTVGTGSFGRVHLAQSKVNGKHYAIKVLDKYDVVRLKQVEHVNNEPSILREISHPFLITLWDAFQDDTHLFMVLDYIPGGELFRVLRKHKKFSEQTAKFYAAEVLLALAYLHDNGIVYRDLKPENILIDARGHVKLTDFGFAKRVDDVTWTVCGTPDYLAPEIILSKGYTKAVDWWGLGVLIFEMVVGRAPFVDKNPVDLYQKILECRVDWPDDISPTLKDLLSNLLTNDVEGRFTSREIKEHEWFADTNFDQVLRRKMKPPYIPKVKDDGDTACFAKYKEPAHGYGRIRGDPFRSKFPAF